MANHFLSFIIIFISLFTLFLRATAECFARHGLSVRVSVTLCNPIKTVQATVA